jgi:hypothetical protein
MVSSYCNIWHLDNNSVSMFNAGENSIKKGAIEKGFAEHDSITGEWQWKGD